MIQASLDSSQARSLQPRAGQQARLERVGELRIGIADLVSGAFTNREGLIVAPERLERERMVPGVTRCQARIRGGARRVSKVPICALCVAATQFGRRQLKEELGALTG